MEFKRAQRNIICRICNKKVSSKSIKTRSKLFHCLYRCEDCNFEFFDSNPYNSIVSDQFEEKRLGDAGISISEKEEDFKNGYKQSKELVEKYINKEMVGKEILEIGCSYGYFLKCVQDKNFNINCTGVELNPTRCNFVKKKLLIDCYQDINDERLKSKKFDVIFLFYTLEYIKDPNLLIKNLLMLLKPKGKVIFYTPNLQDALKDIWINNSFRDFFYEIQSINYFSPNSLEKLLLKNLSKNEKYSVQTIQDYSFFNHFNWFLNNKPLKTGKVGGDYISQELEKTLADNSLGKELKDLIINFNKSYKKILEKNHFGNIIVAEIFKK